MSAAPNTRASLRKFPPSAPVRSVSHSHFLGCWWRHLQARESTAPFSNSASASHTRRQEPAIGCQNPPVRTIENDPQADGGEFLHPIAACVDRTVRLPKP